MNKKQKIGKRKAAELIPFEDALDLRAMVQMKLRGRHAGAYLLQKGDNQLRFVFGFECSGIHSYIRSEVIAPIFHKMEVALRDLPHGERLTFHLGTFASDRERQKELEQLVENTPSEELAFLLTGERARIRELRQLGLRKPKFLRIYVTYTIEPQTHGAQDFIEKTIARGAHLWEDLSAKGKLFWNTYKGTAAQQSEQQMREVMRRAFADGFQRCEQLLSNKMGLEVRPLSEQELWGSLWQRLNRTKPIPIPQLLILDDAGVREEVHNETDASTLLLAEDTPVADRQWVHVRDGYVGALAYLDKPGGWSDMQSQLRYLWEIIARDEVSDTEIFVELSPANPKIVKTNAQRLLKQSNTIAATAEKAKSMDVAALVKVRRSAAAQEKLFEGEAPVYVAVTILAHRKTQDELDSATAFLEDCFRLPAVVKREKEYAWKLWLDTLPVTWSGQLTRPFDRRKLYLTSEAVGLLPAVMTHPGDRQGFELIAEDDGTPILVDIFSEPKHGAVFGTTGSGKSVLVSSIITQALVRGWPVVGVDFPKEDGVSTYTDYIKFLGNRGAYFDISTEANNLFEMPDLRQFSYQVRQERFDNFKNFLLSALMTMVVGKSRDYGLNQTIRHILGLALNAFFANQEIQQRYEQAIEQGFGSEAWTRTPTLEDYLQFCREEHLSLDTVSRDIHRGLSQIHASLNFWLKSNVGRAIGTPSTFPTNAQAVIYALRSLNSGDDAAVLALSATSAALRRTLESPDSLFLLDEGSVLFEYEDFAKMVGRFYATGRRSGQRVILISQDPNAIANSVAGEQIFQNTDYTLTGRIKVSAIKSFVKLFDYPLELISKNASSSYYPKKAGIYSQWLLDYGGLFTQCRFYPGYVQLAVTANSRRQQAARTWFLKRYPDKFVALTEFSKYLISWIREGRQPYPLEDKGFDEPDQQAA